ncbi:MAG: nucleotidyltransferase family protein [Proteobacteria bacterium]|nr:nucleotidyltransferase family protein [Pseudomonadota bacterium]
MRAMILAAGRGERMRPLTDTLPKPLLEVRGKPLIEWHLEALAAAGVREIVINVSHLADRVMQSLGDGRRWGVSLAWSREDHPLETAGGIATARAQLGEAPFLLVNADVHCDYPLARLAALDLGGLLGHIVLVPNPRFRPDGDFSLATGRVGNEVGNPRAPRYTYSGIGLIRPALVDGVAPGSKAPLAPLLRRAAAGGLLGGEVYPGLWSDVGTPERLAELNRAFNRTGSP